jgi:hypothetical protein
MYDTASKRVFLYVTNVIVANLGTESYKNVRTSRVQRFYELHLIWQVLTGWLNMMFCLSKEQKLASRMIGWTDQANMSHFSLLQPQPSKVINLFALCIKLT